MPLNKSIHKVMVIGSGPIVIGQAAEFDYAGTQACKALKEQGLQVVLVNSNPATLMTDHTMADAVYIEPLIPETIERIIEKDKPDSLLSTLGGQTGLTLSMKLAKSGFLKKRGVKLLGARPDTIDKAEDRQIFKDTMLAIGEPCIPSKVVTTLKAALAYADKEIGYPVIVRPAFTLGGTGGGIAQTRSELEEIAQNGLRRSPIHQILVEKCVTGWKEIEFEVMRDSAGNAITVCSMENVDPVGVHTGDSLVVAPTMTLAEDEYRTLRSAALNIINSLNMEGGCNVQFAVKPENFEYAVIEVNPRVSRSSALASKATGYPIARVATLIAVGYNLNEIPHFAAAQFEPVVDYVVVKMPRFPFDKFVYAQRELGTQMKATGEVMSIGHTFEEALMKAARGAEIGTDSLRFKAFANESNARIKKRVKECTDVRLFAIYEALVRGIMPIDEINKITKIDMWFLAKIQHLAFRELQLASIKNSKQKLTPSLYLEAKKEGFPDKVISELSGVKIPGAQGICKDAKKAAELVQQGKLAHIPATYKIVDTCGKKFSTKTPYFYSGYDKENEAVQFLAALKKSSHTTSSYQKSLTVKNAGSSRQKTAALESKKGTIIVLGSGPIRIGQGIEFDYASVQCVWSLKKLGYDVVTINNNPETVSTDFDTADRLYFEPLTPEDVMSVINTENPIGVVVAFGGQTAIKLTKFLDKQGIKILGTSADSIDIAEDRERFESLCVKLGINKPVGETVLTTEEALAAAKYIGYPVLLRPSYVLGGQNMIIAWGDADVKEYMAIILSQGIENPVLIDKYMSGTELEVDAICDGKDILIPGIMEHIERAGIHSGDSIAVYPSWNLNDILRQKIIAQSRELALALHIKGLINIQYLIYNNDIYVIEVNPRSSRTVPYISKVTGVPMVELATRAMLGEKVQDFGYGTGLYRIPPYFAVKVPVFSFEKLMDVDTHLGPEMKSTGEVLGLASTMEEAIYKGLVGAGYKMKRGGGVLFTVRKTDQFEIPDIARKFYDMGFTLYATKGTGSIIKDFGMDVTIVNKIHENPNDNLLTLLDTGKIDYVISTSTKGRNPHADSVRMRRHAVERDIPCLTALDTANAIANCLASQYNAENVELVDINNLRESKEQLRFCKMACTGNDFILIDAREQPVSNPAGLAVRLCHRRTGIGADSLVLIKNSDTADAYMQFFNQDGSEGRMAGNAIRAVAKYLYDNNINNIKSKSKEHAPTGQLVIDTASGIKSLVLYKQNDNVSSVTVDMGKPQFTPESLPTTLAPVAVKAASGSRQQALPAKAIVNVPLKVAGKKYDVTCLSVGTPHCVVFCGFVDKVDVAHIGPQFENHAAFPNRTNTEFVRVVGRNELKMRTWERGNGETPACGTGACAAAIAAVLNGYCPMNENITVKVRGGTLIVKYTGDTVYLTGQVERTYEGSIEI
ncbi:MAG: carbamoyl-phosphate synthase large subunit [Treponema sp.]|nr:carbamoyl-phosphate synthase large subunit [Treponema sp.]